MYSSFFKRAVASVSAAAFATSVMAQEPAPATSVEPPAQTDTQLLGLPTSLGHYIVNGCTADKHTASFRFNAGIDLGILAGMEDPDKFKRTFNTLTGLVLGGNYNAAVSQFTSEEMKGEKSGPAVAASLDALNKTFEFSAQGKADQILIGVQGGRISAEADCEGPSVFECRPSQQIGPGQFLMACARVGRDLQA